MDSYIKIVTVLLISISIFLGVSGLSLKSATKMVKENSNESVLKTVKILEQKKKALPTPPTLTTVPALHPTVKHFEKSMQSIFTEEVTTSEAFVKAVEPLIGYLREMSLNSVLSRSGNGLSLRSQSKKEPNYKVAKMSKIVYEAIAPLRQLYLEDLPKFIVPTARNSTGSSTSTKIGISKDNPCDCTATGSTAACCKSCELNCFPCGLCIVGGCPASTCD